MSAQQQRHVPLNEDSELESYEPAAAPTPGAVPAAHIALNSESEFSAADDDDAAGTGNGGDRGRGRLGAGPAVGFKAQTGAYAEPNSGDDDDTLPPLSDARARSRTPRGAGRSKSRSRSRARAQGLLKTEVLMNDASEESSGGVDVDEGVAAAASGSADEGRVGRSAGYVPQNSGSDTDADAVHPSKHINTSAQAHRSRSRSQNRAREVRYQAPLNSESETDEVQTTVRTGPPSAAFERVTVPMMNEESENE